MMDEIDIKIIVSQQPTLNYYEPTWQEDKYVAIGKPNQEILRIIIKENVLAQLHELGSLDNNEIGGILLGEAHLWQDYTYCLINSALPAITRLSSPTHFTFSADTWAEMIRKQQQEYPNLQLLGWYHSHPNMDISLSSMDLEIQRGYFLNYWQIALVINAQNKWGGIFIWDKDKIRGAKGFFVLKTQSGCRQISIEQKSNMFIYREL